MGFLSDNINKYLPSLALWLINKPAAKKRWKNSVEQGVLVKNQKLAIKKGSPSVIFFSCHKSGSSIGLKYLKKLANENNLKHINYDACLSSLEPNKRLLFTNADFLDRAFVSTQYFFGCFRTYRNIPQIGKYKVILLLRDPRDVLVSHYYNVKNIKKIRQKKGLKERERVKKMSLDDYVLETYPRFKKVYEDYIQNLLGKENVYSTKFEDLLADSAGWLKAASEHCNLKCSEDLLQNISTGITSNLKVENKHKHHRKASPGEFKQKLKEETIQKLNAEFKVILEKLNYAI
jgi:hypothetical protein